MMDNELFRLDLGIVGEPGTGISCSLACCKIMSGVSDIVEYQVSARSCVACSRVAPSTRYRRNHHRPTRLTQLLDYQSIIV